MGRYGQNNEDEFNALDEVYKTDYIGILDQNHAPI